MIQLMQLLQNQKQPVIAQFYFKNGASISMQNVKVFSNHILVGSDQFHGKTFISIKNIKGYCFLPKPIKQIEKNIKSDTEQASNMQQTNETSKWFSKKAYSQTNNDYFNAREAKNEQLVATVEKQPITRSTLNLDSNQVSLNSDPSKADNTPLLNLLESKTRSNNITIQKTLSESQQSIAKKADKLAATNTRLSSTNGNSIIKDSGIFTNVDKC
ncbi:hypothetical protein [Paraliobacillus sediminis]|uniref:hypothetical protein n=1 Tax=Paraliobacillus sediminis TaxID=1885916 RepID=UPI000E3ECB11|nr:hypothetical protein [Paraliobacillus sediminis]